MWRKTVELQNPYNWEQVLQRLAMDPLHAVDIEKSEIKVPLIVNETEIVVSVQGTGPLAAPAFVITSEGPEEDIIQRISKIFGWQQDMERIHSHFLQTNLRPIFKTFAYTPIVLEFNYFDCLVRCIIHQQLNLKFAFTLTERFVHTYGKQIDGVWFYPTPAVVAKITVEELRALQFSQRKAEYMIHLAQHIVSGHLHLDDLGAMSDEEVMKTLLPLRGIGPWTVQNFLMFALGRPNMFPKADIGLQRAVQQLLGLSQKPDDHMLEELKQQWEPYGSYASLYLWRSIE
ncbi:DNA-3-methyladenine glycosylase [Ectobacillus sp. JY-23]|uniref:DNA-3-methyladenine glycosylase family protein n=1 Tax=Ectobacillus sp. JY-23 TaxID=2933872 RepID=UPI001FF1ADCC|nr:DNA-3-methyladenine glycosylase [Ectobacillus sp. JY-23]UOY91706.1 DNA-3-methyladenine glycosylase [Ectobacillus sp. JY-23]